MKLRRTRMLLYCWLFLSLLASQLQGQIAYFQSLPILHEEDQRLYQEIVFEINGQRFSAQDSNLHALPMLGGMNVCKAMLPKDTLTFLAHFQYGQHYLLKPGCCCALFTMEAKHAPSRGTVSVKNTTAETLVLTVCEHNADTLAPGESTTIYASESAMCLFKPCHIVLASPDFFDQKYAPDINGHLSAELMKERAQYLHKEVHFQFLHGENLWLLPRKNKKEALLKLKKAWTKDELRDWAERGY